MPQNAIIDASLVELHSFMELYGIANAMDAKLWAQAMSRAMLVEPDLINRMSIWVMYAMMAGYNVGYQDGKEDQQ